MPGIFKLKYALEIFEFVMFFCAFPLFSYYGNLNHVCIVDLKFFMGSHQAADYSSVKFFTWQ